MLILAIDTATSAIAVAVVEPGAAPVRAVETDPRGHTERLAPLVRQALAEAGVAPSELTDIAVGTGPGPFTGLRVGMVTARTMGHALGIPVHGVCSLDALAEQAFAVSQDPEVLVATDARRREVYWARYARVGGAGRALTPPAVSQPAQIPHEARMLAVAGRAPLLYPESFPRPLPSVLDVDPAVLAHVAACRIDSGAPLPGEPLYLRRPDALTTAERDAR